jgi:hypothetical protein
VEGGRLSSVRRRVHPDTDALLGGPSLESETDTTQIASSPTPASPASDGRPKPITRPST